MVNLEFLPLDNETGIPKKGTRLRYGRSLVFREFKFPLIQIPDWTGILIGRKILIETNLR